MVPVMRTVTRITFKLTGLMKKNLTTSVAAAIWLLLFATSCTDKGQETFHYVNVSQVACSFLGESNQSLEITVKASPAQWTATPGATWVKIERTDEKTLTITVDDNDTGAERNTTVTIDAGEASQTITVNQLPKDSAIARYRKLDTFQMGARISPSGKYAGGFTASIAADDSFQYTPTIVDLETGEWHEFGPYPESVHYLHQTMAITDQGLLFISDGANGGQIAIDLTGNLFIPESPAGFRGKPEIQATSADGKYWVGYAMKGKVFEDPAPCKALLWIDGVPHELPWPDLNYRDEEPWYGGMARGISADGSVIYGTSWENWDFGMLYWINNGESTAKPEWVGKDVREVTPVTMKMSDGTEYETHIVNGMICTANLTNISATGKWIAGSYRTETPNEDGLSIAMTQVAAFFNTETETTVIVEDYGESTGVHVTDDGIGFIGVGSLGISSGKVYDLNTGTDLGSTQDWVYDNYGIIIPAGYINHVSADGRFVLGTKAESSAMGVSFINWYIAPPIAK